MIGAAHRDLLNLSRISDLMIQNIFLWTALTQAPKHRQLTELKDYLDWTSDALGVKLPTVATSLLFKKVVTLNVRMRNPEDLTGGFQPFILGQHTDV